MVPGPTDGTHRVVIQTPAGGAVSVAPRPGTGGSTGLEAPLGGADARPRGRPAGPRWRLALVALAALPVGGCAVDLRMAEVEDPSQATSTITYTGVREQTRRFPDYGSIDEAILDTTVGSEP